MLRLINIEIKKMFRLKTLIVMVLFFLFCSFLASNANAHIIDAIQGSDNGFIDEIIESNEKAKKDLTEELEKYKKLEKESAVIAIQDGLKRINDRLELLYAQKNSPKDTVSRLDYKIKELELSLKNIENRNYNGITRSKESITKDLEIYKAYKDAGIIPDDERLTALRFIKEFPVNMNPLFVIIFVVLLAGDAVSSEHSGSTFRSYLSQPVTRGKVISSKYIGTIIASIFAFISIELIVFVYTGLTKGWGPLNTPVEFGARYVQVGKTINYIIGSQSFMPGYRFVIYSLLLQSLYIAAAASIGFLISCIFKKPVTSISFSVCVMFTIYTIVQKIKAFPAIHKYIFSYYFDISLLITQSFQYNISDLTLNMKNGIIVMGTTCLVCFIISYLIFRRQEIYS